MNQTTVGASSALKRH